MSWRHYHDSTKHSVESLRRSRYTLDWANMPNPFRHYDGTPVLDLPADPPCPQTPTLEVLTGGLTNGQPLPADGATFLSQLLFYSASISATKISPSGSYYSLRVNPSSGNLHPTEFHFSTRGLAGWPDGLYHYRPSSHMAEQRATGQYNNHSTAPIVFVLTSIAWREAWKYRDRAYRYCLHDIGHAWQSLALAAQALGCETFATGLFPDADIQSSFAADEWPMLLLELRGPGIPLHPSPGTTTIWHGGQPNTLSEEIIDYPSIHAIHEATSQANGTPKPAPTAPIPVAVPPSPPFGQVVRQRRSALNFIGGDRSMSLAQLSTLLAAAFQPLQADFAGNDRLIHLYLYAHRIDGLPPGVYRYWPGRRELEPRKQGDQRVIAAGLSLGQDLAGNACVAFSMIGDLDRATAQYGDRGYRFAYFEAGAIGQRLYLGAESLGLRATGIGAFYDDEVHRYLGITPGEGQVVYHFAIGHPVPDPRLTL